MGTTDVAYVVEIVLVDGEGSEPVNAKDCLGLSCHVLAPARQLTLIY